MPVIAGLLVGIIFVVAFALPSNNLGTGSSPSHYVGGYPHMGLSLDGIKQTYSTEEIDFTLTAKGYGKYCPVDPSIAIFSGALPSFQHPF